MTYDGCDKNRTNNQAAAFSGIAGQSVRYNAHRHAETIMFETVGTARPQTSSITAERYPECVEKDSICEENGGRDDERLQNELARSDSSQGRLQERSNKPKPVALAYRLPTEARVKIHVCLFGRKELKTRRLVQFAALQKSKSKEIEVQAARSTVPPVTKEKLKELELLAIQNNLSLRIDLVFDHELFFQRISGRKGEDKKRAARVFWELLSLELQANAHALQGGCEACKHGEDGDLIPSRLGPYFVAVRDLFEMLLPDADKEYVVRELDVDHLVKMARTGQLDPENFSEWLAGLVMKHCAPMRDEMARDMQSKISEGARTDNTDLLVEGMETLLNLLENMKLDVANHQVRSFKLLLIADTVPFLKDCFSKMIASEQLDLAGAKDWYTSLRNKHDTAIVSDFECFMRGIAQLCDPAARPPPSTFVYDKDRIQCLQNDVLDLSQLRLCKALFYELAREPTGRAPTDTETTEVMQRILKLIVHEDGTSDGIDHHMEEVAIEIARAASEISSAIGYTENAVTRRVDFQYAIEQFRAMLDKPQTVAIELELKDLFQRTLRHARSFSRMDTLKISNAQRNWSVRRSSESSPLAPDMEDMARRLAHVAVVHWQVWSELIYLKDSRPEVDDQLCLVV